MIDILMRTSQPLDHNSILHINISTQNITNLPHTGEFSRQNDSYLTQPSQAYRQSDSYLTQPSQAYPSPNPAQNQGNFSQIAEPQSAAPISELVIPPLKKQIQKGQKVPLNPSGSAKHIQVCLGWNVSNPQCDLDVSAFILGKNGKALGDDWFVFYGQEYSPDQSVRFSLASHTDREFISVDLQRLNPAAAKIVFVLTINDAFLHHLNFSMVKDAYIRILDTDTRQELVSFQMTDYYPNVISMMIGEIYLYNGIWKCNAIGNGVAKDLAGLCQLYGVETV